MTSSLGSRTKAPGKSPRKGTSAARAGAAGAATAAARPPTDRNSRLLNAAGPGVKALGRLRVASTSRPAARQAAVRRRAGQGALRVMLLRAAMVWESAGLVGCQP